MLRALISLCALMTLASLAFGPSICVAQVLEINSLGVVKVYDGPAVVTETGVIPIVAWPDKNARSAAGRRVGRAEIAGAAKAADLSPDLIAAVALRESGLRSGVVSRAGAIGAMQLTPATARTLGVNPRDPAQNLRGGAGYLKALMRRYDGDLVKTLAAYNAGPAAVDRYRGVPPFKETRAYVEAVLDRLSQVAEGQRTNSGGSGQ